MSSLLSLLTLATLALAAFGVGRCVFVGVRLNDEDTAGAVVWPTAVGLVACGTFLAVLGLAGWLHEAVIGVITLVAAFWGLGEALQLYAERWYDPPPPSSEAPSRPNVPSPPRWLARVFAAFAAATLLGSLVCALAPPTAGDALCYHLELPKRFLLEHRLTFLPDSDNSTYPLLAEMWYAWAMTLEGGVAAQLMHWLVGALLALATVVLAAPIVGRSWAWAAAAVVLLVPGVNNQMTAPLNDAALALFTTLAVVAWRKADEEENPRWLLVAGTMLGGALATKYVALVFCMALFGVAAWLGWRLREKRLVLLTGVATMAVVAVSFSGLWYVRAAWHRGNPVYPFFEEFASAETITETLPARKAALGRSPAALFTAPWQLTMQPERFGGRAFQLGPLFLLGLPALLAARRLRGAGMLLALAGVYGVGWFLLRQNVRFLLPTVPLVAVPLVWAASELRRWPRLPRAIIGGLALAFLAGSAALPLWRARDSWPVALGVESREAYLHRREPTYAAAIDAVDLLGREMHILSQEHRAFYLPGRVTRENIYRRRTGYDRTIAAPEQASRALLDAGFTHVLLADTDGGAGLTYDPTLSRLIDAQRAVIGEDHLTSLVDYKFRDTDGVQRHYRLIMLR